MNMKILTATLSFAAIYSVSQACVAASDAAWIYDKFITIGPSFSEECVVLAIANSGLSVDENIWKSFGYIQMVEEKAKSTPNHIFTIKQLSKNSIRIVVYGPPTLTQIERDAAILRLTKLDDQLRNNCEKIN